MDRTHDDPTAVTSRARNPPFLGEKQVSADLFLSKKEWRLHWREVLVASGLSDGGPGKWHSVHMRAHLRPWFTPVLIAATLAVTACSSSESAEAPTPSDDGAATTVVASDDSSDTSSPTEPESTEPTCEQPGVRDCLLPFPSNRLTVVDGSTATGRRIAIPADAAPVNVDGVAMDLTDQNRADGFSPSSAIVFAADGVDLTASGVPDADDIGASIDGSSPIVLDDLDGGGLWPYWAELDVQSQLVTIRPAVLLTEGHTYRVTIGDLVDADGNAIEIAEPSWEFTVASTESLAGRLLSMLDATYADIGDGAPAFVVESNVDQGGVRIVDGTFEIPNYLDNDGTPSGRLTLDDAGTPVRNDTTPSYDARFHCVLPTAVAAPVPTVVYGHGLLGDRTEVDFFSTFAAGGSLAACATDWLGMSSEDIANLAGILGDMGRFGEQADRMLAGQLAFQMLGRLVNGGFNTDAAFQTADGSPILAEGGAHFVGNSQGGILGGAATAVSTEWSRAVLGVPGANYSLLLPRSSDWPQFQSVFEAAYTDVDDRLMAVILAQMLWDRGENAGYVQHLTARPYEGRNAKSVLLVGAFGDHQVANVATDVLARTIGARIHTPALAPGRATAVEPFFGIDSIDAYPFDGTAYVMWDYGTPAPPSGPTPPFSPEYGSDPHGAGSSEASVLAQALGFLLDGELQDVCGGEPCRGRQIDE